jgi:hypothetical protein
MTQSSLCSAHSSWKTIGTIHIQFETERQTRHETLSGHELNVVHKPQSTHEVFRDWRGRFMPAHQGCATSGHKVTDHFVNIKEWSA